MRDEKPICHDLFCGLGGWAEAFLAEGYRVIGYDIERHDYGTGGYPGELILKNVLELDGTECSDAAVIVASPPCTEYSYMAMPWSRAKQIRRALRGEDTFPEGYKGSRTLAELNALFDVCFRIQREASAASGRHIPLIVENVRGACEWVGPAKWHFGSFYLWGDVPALMPTNKSGAMKGSVGTVNGSGRYRPQSSWDRGQKVPGFRFDGSGRSFQSESVKVGGIKLSEVGFNVAVVRKMLHGDPNVSNAEGRKQGGDWFGANCESSMSRLYGSKSPQRKMASAMIAKIPFALARHIARSFKP